MIALRLIALPLVWIVGIGSNESAAQHYGGPAIPAAIYGGFLSPSSIVGIPAQPTISYRSDLTPMQSVLFPSYVGPTSIYQSFYTPLQPVISAPGVTLQPRAFANRVTIPATIVQGAPTNAGYSTSFGPIQVVGVRPVLVSPKVYVPGQPFRNAIRAVTP